MAFDDGRVIRITHQPLRLSIQRAHRRRAQRRLIHGEQDPVADRLLEIQRRIGILRAARRKPACARAIQIDGICIVEPVRIGTGRQGQPGAEKCNFAHMFHVVSPHSLICRCAQFSSTTGRAPWKRAGIHTQSCKGDHAGSLAPVLVGT